MVARSHIETQARIPPTQKITASPFDPLVKALFPKLAAITPRFITPNMITVIGLLSTIAIGAALILTSHVPALLLVGAALILVNWVADTLDGVVARQRNQCSRLGDFYDHVFDAFSVAAINVGLAFSPLAHVELPLILATVFLLNFAITYKGEQATGVYELLTFGPTEVRFAVFGFFVAAYLMPGPIVTVFGVGLQVLDLASLVGIFWSLVYILVLFRRYVGRLREAESQ